MADKKEASGDDGGEVVAKKSRKGKLIIIGVAFAGLAAGAYVMGSKTAAPAAQSGGTTTSTTIALIDGCVKKPEDGVPKTLVDLPEMSINLADGHYLAAISLGLCADVVLGADQEFPSAPAKDLIVSGLSGQDMAQLSTAEGRKVAKDALTEQISAAYRGVVYEVFFVEFVMQ